MGCPMFVDFTRECLDKVGFVPSLSTLYYCQTDKHKDCPFFKTINKIGTHCDCLEKCPSYNHFKIYDFDRFVEIANHYCLSDNHVNCERYKLRKSGQTPPADMLPDGSRRSS